jgi:hypothetical protein
MEIMLLADFPTKEKPKDRDERRLAIVRVSAVSLEHILKGLVRPFTSNAPDDLEIVGMDIDQRVPDIILLKCRSASFGPVFPGCSIPYVDIIFAEASYAEPI